MPDQSDAPSKKELIEALNDALRYEYEAVITYNTFASVVSGPYRGELREFFLEEINDELGHAKFLADKVSALGGDPATTAADVPHATEPQQMLEKVLAAETEAVKRYSDLMEMAEAYGDLGLANDIHEMISDETSHKEETEKLLNGRWA